MTVTITLLLFRSLRNCSLLCSPQSALAPHRLVLVPSSPGAVSMTPEGRHVSEEGAEGVPEEEVDEEEDDASFEELRCVLAVVRHGDRTPKQKVKVKVMNRLFMDLLHKYMEGKGKQAKLKSPNQMQELLDVTREVVAQLQERKKQGPLDDDTAGAWVGGWVGK